MLAVLLSIGACIPTCFVTLFQHKQGDRVANHALVGDMSVSDVTATAVGLLSMTVNRKSVGSR